MGKVKFTELKRPFICTIISDQSPADCIRTIKLSDYDGSDAYEMNLMVWEKRSLNMKALATG
jgi:hypothetical protein